MKQTPTLQILQLAWLAAFPPVALADEAEIDSFGGFKNIKGAATGRFHLEEIDERHYLITPEGHGFVAMGVTHTGGMFRTGAKDFNIFSERYERRHRAASTDIVRNLKAWGYNALGYDNHPTTGALMPYMGSCTTSRNSLWKNDPDFQFDDVFSPQWREMATAAIERMVARNKKNPNLIGYYWTDMPAWNLVTTKKRKGLHWVDYIRSLPDTAPGKQRYLKFVKADQRGSDREFLILMAREYYRHVGSETKRLDPDTLVFGERYPGMALDFDVIKEAIPHIDVISVQPGGVEYMEGAFDRLHEVFKKPIVICDHQCSFPTDEHPTTMWKQLDSVGAVNRAHNAYMEKAFSKPYLIGYFRCQYIDRLKGDQLKQGLMTDRGKPYAELIENVTEINRRILSSFSKK